MAPKKTIRSEETFVEEYGLLKDIPGLLYESPGEYISESGRDIEEELSTLGSLESEGRYPNDIAGVPPEKESQENEDWTQFGSSPWDWTEISGIPAEDFFKPDKAGDGFVERLLDETGIDIEALKDAVWNDDSLAANTANFGTDALASYLPWHVYVNSPKTPWGMYLPIKNLFAWGKTLWLEGRSIGLPLEEWDGIRLAFWVAYRHELFHYHVERFAITQEVVQRRPIYRPYVKEVYADPAVAGTSAWLEEALAQAVVLRSRIVQGGLGLGKFKRHLVKSLLVSQFRDFPPGYRDYECIDFGGTDKAHRLLGAQIVTAWRSPQFTVSDLAIPKLEYKAARIGVPAYILVDAQTASQFQFATPRLRRSRKWMTSKAGGFEYYGTGPGDHEVYRYKDGRKVTVNARGADIDIASLKAISKIKEVPIYKLRELINAA